MSAHRVGRGDLDLCLQPICAIWRKIQRCRQRHLLQRRPHGLHGCSLCAQACSSVFCSAVLKESPRNSLVITIRNASQTQHTSKGRWHTDGSCPCWSIPHGCCDGDDLVEALQIMKPFGPSAPVSCPWIWLLTKLSLQVCGRHGESMQMHAALCHRSACTPSWPQSRTPWRSAAL